MPDLTVHTACTCSSNEEWFVNVPSSRGGYHTVTFGRLYGRDLEIQGCQYGYTCTCDGFHFRRDCTHVRDEKTRELRCGWNAGLDPTIEPDRDAEGNPRCPECGAPVTLVQVAV